MLNTDIFFFIHFYKIWITFGIYNFVKYSNILWTVGLCFVTLTTSLTFSHVYHLPSQSFLTICLWGNQQWFRGGCIILTQTEEHPPSRAETPYPYQFLTHWQGLAHQGSSSSFPHSYPLALCVCSENHESKLKLT